jgi:hypothetical protein
MSVTMLVMRFCLLGWMIDLGSRTTGALQADLGKAERPSPLSADGRYFAQRAVSAAAVPVRDATNPGTLRDAWSKHNPGHGATRSFMIGLFLILPSA